MPLGASWCLLVPLGASWGCGKNLPQKPHTKTNTETTTKHRHQNHPKNHQQKPCFGVLILTFGISASPETILFGGFCGLFLWVVVVGGLWVVFVAVFLVVVKVVLVGGLCGWFFATSKKLKSTRKIDHQKVKIDQKQNY